MAVDAAAHSATLTLVAGSTSGFNFNGASKGHLMVSVPSGHKVTMLFQNAAILPHSAVVTAFAAFFVGQALLADYSLTARIDQPEVLRTLVGCGLYRSLLGLLGLALGVVIRGAAGAWSPCCSSCPGLLPPSQSPYETPSMSSGQRRQARR